MTASYAGTIEQEVVSTDSLTYQITVTGGLTGSAADDLTYTVMLAYFGNNLDSAVASGSSYPLVAGLPADGCSALQYSSSLPGKVVLLQRGNCTFQTKVRLLAHHHAQGIHDNIIPRKTAALNIQQHRQLGGNKPSNISAASLDCFGSSTEASAPMTSGLHAAQRLTKAYRAVFALQNSVPYLLWAIGTRLSNCSRVSLYSSSVSIACTEPSATPHDETLCIHTMWLSSLDRNMHTATKHAVSRCRPHQALCLSQ